MSLQFPSDVSALAQAREDLPWFDPSTDDSSWHDWKWQLRAAIRTPEQLFAVFPALSETELIEITRNSLTRRMMITPYALTLVQRDNRKRPRHDDPLWRQFVASWVEPLDTIETSQAVGWEHPLDMISPNVQRKYPNRVLVRTTNSCLGYCQFCVLSVRTLDRQSGSQRLDEDEWQATISFIEGTPDIEEVILSGGDPLLLSDELLRKRLRSLRALDRPLIIRINTRALTHNPFRITARLLEIFAECDVNALSIHVTHPNELTAEFRAAVSLLRRVVPVMVSHIPLLRGVNNDAQTMRRLCMELYREGIVGGYLFHFSPNTPGATVFGTSIAEGIDIMRALRRFISSPAVPDFVLLHPEGKLNVPIDDEFVILGDDIKGASARFTNWRGDSVEYKSK